MIQIVTTMWSGELLRRFYELRCHSLKAAFVLPSRRNPLLQLLLLSPLLDNLRLLLFHRRTSAGTRFALPLYSVALSRFILCLSYPDFSDRDLLSAPVICRDRCAYAIHRQVHRAHCGAVLGAERRGKTPARRGIASQSRGLYCTICIE